MPIIKRPKPKAIVFDITGTVAKKAFMTNSEESKNFIRNYVHLYVSECWTRKEFRLAINFLKKPQMLSMRAPQSMAGQSPPPIADITAPIEEQVKSVIIHVLWRLDTEGLSPPLAYFHLNMSDWGYSKGLLLTPVYEEVPAVLKKWKTEDDIKLYVTLGSASFLKKVFTKTTHGDLLPLIEGHMNLMGKDGVRKDFTNLAALIGESPKHILFITRLPQDARRANNARIPVVIILRSDFDPKGADILKNIDKVKEDTSKTEKTPKDKKTSKFETMASLDADERRAIASNIETLTSGMEEEDLNATSKVTEKDLRDFPVIQRLDELVWT